MLSVTAIRIWGKNVSFTTTFFFIFFFKFSFFLICMGEGNRLLDLLLSNSDLNFCLFSKFIRQVQSRPPKGKKTDVRLPYYCSSRTMAAAASSETTTRAGHQCRTVSLLAAASIIQQKWRTSTRSRPKSTKNSSEGDIRDVWRRFLDMICKSRRTQ